MAVVNVERVKRPPKEHDPEDDAFEDESDEDNTDSDRDHGDTAGTEHYVTVPRSELRQRLPLHVGLEYKGKRISRAALEESDEDEGEETEDEDERLDGLGDEDESVSGGENGPSASGSEEFLDPNDVDLGKLEGGPDEEIDSDEALGESDQDWFDNFMGKGGAVPGKTTARKSAATKYPCGSEAQEYAKSKGKVDDVLSGNSTPSSSEEDEDVSDTSDEGNEESSEESEADVDGEDGVDERAELRKIMLRNEKDVVAAMHSATKADAEKGLAIRDQRKMFDSILHLRIRLQKALVSVNTINQAEPKQEGTRDLGEAYVTASSVAIKLWSTLDDVRQKLLPGEVQAKTGKRKRDDLDSSEELWDHMRRTEEVAMKYRRKVLDKWSSKVRNATTPAMKRRLKSTNTQALSSVLDDALLNSERLVRRAHTPRSCAPHQTAKKLDFDPDIYDDADFYQLLLKELVDQRSGDPTAAATVAVLKSEAKTRKNVDRKASKGRKLRYTVHEKLQNFAAPNDQRTWEDSAIDRLFGALFGQKMGLDEAEASDLGMEDVKVEEEGLKLF